MQIVDDSHASLAIQWKMQQIEDLSVCSYRFGFMCLDFICLALILPPNNIGTMMNIRSNPYCSQYLRQQQRQEELERWKKPFQKGEEKKTKTNNKQNSIACCQSSKSLIIDWQTMIEFQNVCSLLYLSGCPCTGAVPCPMCCSAKFTYLINLLLLFFSLWLLFRRLLFLLAVFFFSPTRTCVSSCFSIIIISVGCYRVLMNHIW